MIIWLYNHYFITFCIVLYYMALAGYGTHQVFSQITQITSAGAAVYATLMALPAAAVALIKWRMGKDNELSDE